MGGVVAKNREVAFNQATIDKSIHEMAVLKRLKRPASFYLNLGRLKSELVRRETGKE